MSVRYWILPSAKLAYMKTCGNVTIEDIMLEGASLFTNEGWKNGYNIILDYREATRMDFYEKDVRKLVVQDKMNEHLFDKSRCALVAEKDFAYGTARMWEILSESTRIEIRIFREIDKAIDWLGLNPQILNSKDFNR